ncbi:MAG: CDP-alcohol phosphatidyltransferase family protein [Geminicoccaceae bacterium]|nr:CDP-alcohol phosphatidyltransferase family protein [Geminicoccaceae bacterium]
MPSVPFARPPVVRPPDPRRASALLCGLAVLPAVPLAALFAGTGHGLACLLYLPALLLVPFAFGRQTVLDAFGPANAVTLLRLGLVAALAAGLARPEGAADGWGLALLALLAVALDGVDGHLARQRRETSPFGARFDMEVDTGLILVAALLLVAIGKVGPWALVGPALRPLFVLAGLRWAWLRRDLPPSLRRKLACVAYGLALVAGLLPATPAGLLAPLVLLGLGALVASFARDVLWLRRRAGA